MLQQRSAARLSVAYGVCARAFAHVGRQGAAGSAGVALAAAVTGVAEADGELGQRARPATGRRVILPSCHRLPLAVIP